MLKGLDLLLGADVLTILRALGRGDEPALGILSVQPLNDFGDHTATGEARLYGDILLRKGVIRPG
jgi:L-fucose mutarotase/ribose pyranase (RbsD/FucU family)